MPRRLVRFLDGSEHLTADNGCRGCLMRRLADALPGLIAPLYDDGEVLVQQDAEWPVPGFMVAATVRHYESLDVMPVTTAQRLMLVMQRTRAAMRAHLDVRRVHIYWEEQLGASHVCVRLLPIWEDRMHASKPPRMSFSNIQEYLNSFTVQADAAAIKRCNEVLRRALSDDKDLRRPGS